MLNSNSANALNKCSVRTNENTDLEIWTSVQMFSVASRMLEYYITYGARCRYTTKFYNYLLFKNPNVDLESLKTFSLWNVRSNIRVEHKY